MKLPARFRKQKKISYTSIWVEAVQTSNMEIWIAPAGTPEPTSYPPSPAWVRLRPYS